MVHQLRLQGGGRYPHLRRTGLPITRSAGGVKMVRNHNQKGSTIRTSNGIALAPVQLPLRALAWCNPVLDTYGRGRLIGAAAAVCQRLQQSARDRQASRLRGQVQGLGVHAQSSTNNGARHHVR